MGFLAPKPPDPPKPPPPPPTPPTLADATVRQAGEMEDITGYSSLVSTTPIGLRRRAAVAKRSLVGAG